MYLPSSAPSQDHPQPTTEPSSAPPKSLDTAVPTGQVAARIHDLQSRLSPSPSHQAQGQGQVSPHHGQHDHQSHQRPSISSLPREAWYPQYVTASRAGFAPPVKQHEAVEDARQIPLPLSPVKGNHKHESAEAGLRDDTPPIDEGFEILRRERAESPIFEPTIRVFAERGLMGK